MIQGSVSCFSASVDFVETGTAESAAAGVADDEPFVAGASTNDAMSSSLDVAASSLVINVVSAFPAFAD